MSIQLIIILALLASVLPLSILMVHFARMEARDEIKIEQERLLRKFIAKVERFGLNRDEALIYLSEGKYNLKQSEINKIVSSIK